MPHYTQEQIIQELNQVVADIVVRETGTDVTNKNAYDAAVKQLFGKEAPNRDELIEEVSRKRQAILDVPEKRAAILNTGANFTPVEQRDGEFYVYLIDRSEGSVGAIGGLSERMSMEPEAFQTFLEKAKQEKGGEAGELVGQLLAAIAEEGRNPEIDAQLREIFEQNKGQDKEAIRTAIEKQNPALVAAIDYIQESGVFKFRGRPVDLLDPENHFEHILGGKDDVALVDGRITLLGSGQIDRITKNNRVREGIEEVGDLGLDIAKAIAEDRLQEVNMEGVRDDAWLQENRGKHLGDPRVTATDFAISPKVALVIMTEEEARGVADAASKHKSNHEVAALRRHSLVDALALSAIAADKGGYQYPHEAYGLLQLALEKTKGDAKAMEELGAQVQARIKEVAKEKGVEEIPVFSATALAEAKRIDLHQLAENLGTDSATLESMNKGARNAYEKNATVEAAQSARAVFQEQQQQRF